MLKFEECDIRFIKENMPAEFQEKIFSAETRR